MSVVNRRQVLFGLRVILVAILIQVLTVWLGVPDLILAITAPITTLLCMVVLDWLDQHVSIKVE